MPPHLRLCLGALPMDGKPLASLRARGLPSPGDVDAKGGLAAKKGFAADDCLASNDGLEVAEEGGAVCDGGLPAASPPPLFGLRAPHLAVGRRLSHAGTGWGRGGRPPSVRSLALARGTPRSKCS